MEIDINELEKDISRTNRAINKLINDKTSEIHTRIEIANRLLATATDYMSILGQIITSNTQVPKTCMDKYKILEKSILSIGNYIDREIAEKIKEGV